jgi:CRISPR-associated protein Csa3
LSVDTLVATLGFDADFVLRRLTRGAPDRIVLLALKVDESSWSRVDSAFKLIQAFCSYRRVNCVLEPVNMDRPVVEVYSILKRELEGVRERLELFLTGGPRIMVVSALLAALLLPPEHSRKVRVVVEGEAFTASLEVDIGILQKILTLDHTERKILLTLFEHQQGLTAPRIAMMSKTPRTSIYRKLHTLESQGLVKKVDGRYKLEDSLKDLMRILPLRGT